jgi:hypothetical protein
VHYSGRFFVFSPVIENVGDASLIQDQLRRLTLAKVNLNQLTHQNRDSGNRERRSECDTMITM